MRLFAAVDIGEALAGRAAELSRELQRRAARQAPRAKVTWVPSERLHLTVRFIGQVDDLLAVSVQEALAPPLGVLPFDLSLEGAGAFPARGAPRVLWLGVRAGAEPLLEVEREMSSRLAPLGMPPEDRPFHPHLTLARVREPAGLRSGVLLDGLQDWTAGTVRVAAITLFHSRLSPKGPTYTPLLQIPLNA